MHHVSANASDSVAMTHLRQNITAMSGVATFFIMTALCWVFHGNSTVLRTASFYCHVLGSSNNSPNGYIHDDHKHKFIWINIFFFCKWQKSCSNKWFAFMVYTCKPNNIPSTTLIVWTTGISVMISITIIFLTVALSKKLNFPLAQFQHSSGDMCSKWPTS